MGAQSLSPSRPSSSASRMVGASCALTALARLRTPPSQISLLVCALARSRQVRHAVRTATPSTISSCASRKSWELTLSMLELHGASQHGWLEREALRCLGLHCDRRLVDPKL